jgi:hypothetical protein
MVRLRKIWYPSISFMLLGRNIRWSRPWHEDVGSLVCNALGPRISWPNSLSFGWCYITFTYILTTLTLSLWTLLQTASTRPNLPMKEIEGQELMAGCLFSFGCYCGIESVLSSVWAPGVCHMMLVVAYAIRSSKLHIISRYTSHLPRRFGLSLQVQSCQLSRLLPHQVRCMAGGTSFEEKRTTRWRSERFRSPCTLFGTSRKRDAGEFSIKMVHHLRLWLV